VISRTHGRFWGRFNDLPTEIQALARKKFRLWQRDPFHRRFNSSRSSEMSGQFESVVAIVLSRVVEMNW